jgi:hypothetical protein
MRGKGSKLGDWDKVRGKGTTLGEGERELAGLALPKGLVKSG